MKLVSAKCATVLDEEVPTCGMSLLVQHYRQEAKTYRVVSAAEESTRQMGFR